MSDKSIAKVKLALKLVGMLLIIGGATLIIIGFSDFISALTRGEEPELFVCSFLGIPIFFLGIASVIYGYMRKVSLKVTKVSMDTEKNLHKVTVIHSLSNEIDTLSKKVCPSCKLENDSDSAFCKHCGTKL